ncbi:MAG TPA: STAS domain-containing protein, partial [Bacteroidetes bacterium]|nr:STAS domain-containing protein [Bacteroidota bacterium]
MARLDRQPGFVIEESGIRLITDLRRGGPPKLLENLSEAVKHTDGESVSIDLASINRLDSLGASFLAELVVRGHVAGKEVHFTGISEGVQKGLARYYYPAPDVRIPVQKAYRLE